MQQMQPPQILLPPPTSQSQLPQQQQPPVTNLIHGIDAADLVQPPKPTTVFINPSFLPKTARSRKDLDMLLEKKLAEALKVC